MSAVRLTKRDISISFDRLIVDARDDFWQDPYRYADLNAVKAEFVNRYVKIYNLLLTNAVGLQRHPVYHWDVPKTNYVVRHAVLLSPYDRLLYHVLLHKLCRVIEPKLEKARYSYRIKKFDDKYIFGRKGVDHWLSFKADIAAAVKPSGPYQYLVSTDIAGFFEYTHLADFKKQIENLTDEDHRPFVNLLNILLKNVAMSYHSGIPQNYDPSSYFSSVFLDFLDKDLKAKGLKHFRYVDDIKVACRTKRDAQVAIMEIIHSLRRMNLNLQSSKTEIWHVADDKFRDFVREFTELLKVVDIAIDRKDRIEIEALLPKLIALTKAELRKREFDERLFRACIRRIVKCHYFKNIVVPPMTSIINKCFKLLAELPGKTDTMADFLSLCKNRKDVQQRVFSLIKESVYFWQEMRLWELLVKSDKIKVPGLLDHAREKLSKGLGQDPVMNMVLLFLGRHGNYNDRLNIARQFEQPHSVYTKRHILIAIQEYRDCNMVYNMALESDDLLLISLVRHIRQLAKPMYTYEDPRIAAQVAQGYEG